jgi:hypothetical protein
VAFFLEIGGALLDVEIAPSDVTVSSRATSSSTVGVVVGSRAAEDADGLEPGASLSLSL